MKIKQTTSKLKVLDFDIENRPLSYWYDGECTAEITAIAASWLHMDEIHGMVVEPGRHGLVAILENFVAMYDRADIVTGHYIIKHDLPHINAALMEHGLSLLQPKYVIDTRVHLKRMKGIPLSQENLGALFRLDQDKYKMTQVDWRNANRMLTSSAFQKTRARVTSDVRQHKALLAECQERGLLRPPRLWKP